jgi:hypothetical protein
MVSLIGSSVTAYVREVRPHAVLLDVPKDGSVPAIGEWQLIRKHEPAAHPIRITA